MRLIRIFLGVVRRTLGLILFCLNWIWPKDPKLMVFHSYPDFTDNSRALYEYITRYHSDEYRCVWILSANMRSKGESYPAESVMWRSMAAILVYCRAKWLIDTHGFLSNWKVRSQRLIELWHGMPLKAMGYMEPNPSVERGLRAARKVAARADLLIATSDMMRAVLAACFGIDARKVVVTGQPRNDALFRKPDELKREFSCMTGIDVSSRKVVLYAPTFRRGFAVDDWKEQSSKGCEFLGEDGLAYLANSLDRCGATLLLRLHPAEEMALGRRLPENVHSVSSEAFPAVDMSLILGITDVLITDYSSCCFDFLLLDRPMVFFPFDMDSYMARRGFVLTPYDLWAPGPIAKTLTEVVGYVKDFLEGQDNYREQRRWVTRSINRFEDAQSCWRVYEAIRQIANHIRLNR